MEPIPLSMSEYQIKNQNIIILETLSQGKIIPKKNNLKSKSKDLKLVKINLLKKNKMIHQLYLKYHQLQTLLQVILK